jgi:hypothetical protein
VRVSKCVERILGFESQAVVLTSRGLSAAVKAKKKNKEIIQARHANEPDLRLPCFMRLKST